MIRPATKRGYCDSCRAYLPLTEGFPDRDGRTLWFCHTCTATPTPSEIDRARDAIRDSWSMREERVRRHGCCTPVATTRERVYLDQVYRLAIREAAKDD